ncbi:Na+-translocating ferredoxin:NAD+ oxidoreductase RNF, RnfC subunit [Halanaerobium congolense]|jgi:Na+-translocating ferredoxin:NAD+ oxidoreductase RnfC subunit|uniref:Na+-translocating ferredoxin:NAD+ oxidoreductase RNF, RnfC subunit n=1 Tax=Halanaerobium congolense TaxID=54121 RepID=A0A1I0A1G2_9FIRM|nr:MULTISPECIES: 4Fe-4S dicluster domain-containing protein [Halanaerobium]KXS49445.1 MAG: respiratory-chain NADH dehydrogenase domain 51 kDa subunit [Halanaerobium sp. T82-1]OEG63746.1 MAG: NADH dehydrogenase [Halanaerobium sp. MDAL1]PTX16118.1 Na+-translocating ferredoxin:NAD+ oxidoreductase RnfC subunit [Halanaerobium congolense]PUU95086.1 MAG: respiratory-chain NADH dehydrogenase domain 51 kDa subunit [Halanaerobium sp.]SDF29829.1 Na+-translocating ferredoxin:NAD+ oxidoreductase RNF, RnfC 
MNIIEKIAKAGVVGAGGAGFPTHIKYDCEAEYLIINGAECEPLLQTDKFLMREFAAEILEAIVMIAENIGAQKIVFATKKKYTKEITCLEKIIAEKNYKNIELFLMDSYYPAGDEQILVYEVTERIVPEGGIPLQVGVVVTNVGTLYNSYRAVKDVPVTDKYVSVLGEVSKARIIQVPLGTSVKDCIAAAGGSTINDYAVIVGGPMMGTNLVGSEIDQAVITKTDGAIIVVPRNNFVIERNKQSIEHIKNKAKAACIQCSLCTEYCPRYLIGHELEPHRIMRALSYNEDAEVLKEAQICCECGICELYACPMGLSPRLVNVYFKNKIKEKFESSQDQLKAHPMRDYRKIPTARQTARLDLDKYDHQALAETLKVDVKEVKIPLKQHIGAPAVFNLEKGAVVKKGELLAAAKADSLSVNIHASLDAQIVEVNDQYIKLKAKDEVVS